MRVAKSRKKSTIDLISMYDNYSHHKQTYKELAIKYWLSVRTIQSYLDTQWLSRTSNTQPCEIILLIDTTYFWSVWLMLFKDTSGKEILHYEIVPYETNQAYKRWIRTLQEQWRIIRAIVCDWRRWLLWWFGEIPTQMCQFHQQQIIRRCITKKPILEANKELKYITDRLHRTDKQTLQRELERRHERHKDFINEQTISPTGKKRYTHNRTRSAYNSLKRNLKYLFVYQDHYWELDIPNTTNGLEAVFSHLKYKVNLHRWLRHDRKLKLILYLIRSREK